MYISTEVNTKGKKVYYVNFSDGKKLKVQSEVCAIRTIVALSNDHSLSIMKKNGSYYLMGRTNLGKINIKEFKALVKLVPPTDGNLADIEIANNRYIQTDMDCQTPNGFWVKNYTFLSKTRVLTDALP